MTMSRPMVRHSAVLLVILLAAVRAFGATHTWIGTISDKISESGNWSGGSPVGDAEAVLVFGTNGVRKAVVNDVVDLPFKELRFTSHDYTISGYAMTATDGSISASGAGYTKIACDLQIAGTLTVAAAYVRGLEIEGQIRGSGALHQVSNTIVFIGQASNTYTGGTTLQRSTMRLARTGGAISIPGDMRIIQDSGGTFIHVDEPEQIANSAKVSFEGYGNLTLNASETMGMLELAHTTVYSDQGTTLAARSVRALRSDSDIRSDLRLLEDDLIVSADAQLEVSGTLSGPPGGVTLRGEGGITVKSSDGTPIRVDGVQAALQVPTSHVGMSSGTLIYSIVKSLVATGGVVATAEAKEDLRLGSAALFHPFVGSTKLNGTLDLGGATLITFGLAGSSPITLVDNASSQPVTGTFAGLPEGSIVENRFRLSYRGGTGNDVTLTPLAKPVPQLVITDDDGYAGEPVTVRATVTGSAGVPTGTVLLRSGDVELATLALTNGTGAAQITFEGVYEQISGRYSGDATYASSDAVQHVVTLSARQPVITSLTPAEGKPGELVDVVVRGSHFVRGSKLHGAFFVDEQRVSTTEIRAQIDLRRHLSPDVLKIKVVSPQSGVWSETVDFTVLREPDTPSILSFDATSAIAAVAPGAATVWMTSYEHPSTLPTVLVDEDRDGLVRRTFSGLPGGVWSVVDGVSGAWAVRSSNGLIFRVSGYAPHTFVRDARGNFSRFMLPLEGEFVPRDWRMVWVRPNVGMWRAFIRDGEDDDKLHNALLVASVSTMRPLAGSSPPPAGFMEGDVVIFMSRDAGGSTLIVYAATLGSEIRQTAPGVLDAATPEWMFVEGGTAKLLVLRSGGSAGTVSVQYSIVPRDENAAHFVAPGTGTLTFGDGETLGWIEVPLLDDNVYRGGGRVDVVLSNPSGATLGNSTVFLVSVLDNEPRVVPTVRLVGPEQRTVRETDGPQTIAVELTLTPAALVPVVLRWTEFGDQSNGGELTFAPGETGKTLELTVAGDDEFNDSDGQRLFDFSAASGSPDMGFRFLRVLLEEDDVSYARAADVRVDESAGAATVTLTLQRGVESALEVYYRTENGTADASDYRPRPEQFLEFAPGETEKTITIPITADKVDEPNETFSLLFYGWGVVHSSPTRVTIIDDDGLPPPSRRRSVRH